MYIHVYTNLQKFGQKYLIKYSFEGMDYTFPPKKLVPANNLSS